MKNKGLIILGAAVLGFVLWNKNKQKADRTAALEADPSMSECNGCSNAIGAGQRVACKSDTNSQGETCQDVCEQMGGTYDTNGTYGGCTGAASTPPPLGSPTRSIRNKGFASVNGWG